MLDKSSKHSESPQPIIDSVEDDTPIFNFDVKAASNLRNDRKEALVQSENSVPSTPGAVVSTPALDISALGKR